MQKPMGIAKTLAIAGLLLAGVAMAADPEKPLQSSVGAQMADLAQPSIELVELERIR